MIDGFAFGGICGVVIDLVQSFDFLQLHLFFGPVEGAEFGGSLEHQVFEVVWQTSGFGGVVLATHTHGDEGLDAGFVLVDGHEDLQTVVQSVMDYVHRVVLVGLFLVILGINAHAGETESGDQQARDKFVFHTL